MTVEEEAKQFLMRNMTEQQANNALRFFKKSEHGKLMTGRWTDIAEDYSSALRATWLASMKLNVQLMSGTIEKD